MVIGPDRLDDGYAQRALVYKDGRRPVPADRSVAVPLVMMSFERRSCDGNGPILES